MSCYEKKDCSEVKMKGLNRNRNAVSRNNPVLKEYKKVNGPVEDVATCS